MLVVNTCAFIDRAKQESIDTILEMAEHKKTGRATPLVVTGCLAERYRDELHKEIPEIDAVLGTGEVPHIVEAHRGRQHRRRRTRRDPLDVLSARSGERGARLVELSEPGAASAIPAPRAASREPPVFGVDLPTYLYDADTPRRLATPGHYAYVKIAEGCDYKCAFCIIPKMRGALPQPHRGLGRARSARRWRRAASRSCCWSRRTPRSTASTATERGALARLLRALERVDGIEWIRLLYLYPTTITDDDHRRHGGERRRSCRYIDLPLQHASDAVLKRMKRPGTRAAYERLLANIRRARCRT